MRASDRPDELTPREREVFDLLRLGLTNEEIAERLGISLDGAKYHVSQILSKLGVSTREEAAASVGETTTVAEAFQPRRGRWWVMLPLAAKAAGVAVMLAAVGGLGVLAWGVLNTSDGTEALREPAESRLPDMVLQPEDVPANMERFDNEDAGLGFQDAEAITGEIFSYGGYEVRYVAEADEAGAGEVACINSRVTVYSTAEDASQALNILSELGADLSEEIALPSIGDQARGFALIRPQAVSCGSYETRESHLVVFRMSNTLSILTVAFSEIGGDVEQSVEYARRQARRVDDVLGGAPLPVGSLPTPLGPRIGDHWHAPYQFFTCGVKQPNAAVWESGVHTHSDGILHIHPFQTYEEGAGARLIKWFEYGGGLLTETEIRIPGSAKTFGNGDLCPDGTPGTLQVFVARAGESAEERLTGDALQQYIPHDGDRIRIVFGTEDEPVVYTDRIVIPPEEARVEVELEVTDDGSELGARFQPDRIEVSAGETVKIVVRNQGTVSRVIRVAGDDGNFGSSDDFVSVPDIILPGDEGVVVVRLDETGEVEFRDDTLVGVVTGVIVVNGSQ